MCFLKNNIVSSKIRNKHHVIVLVVLYNIHTNDLIGIVNVSLSSLNKDGRPYSILEENGVQSSTVFFIINFISYFLPEISPTFIDI